jgi:hypothetical protein
MLNKLYLESLALSSIAVLPSLALMFWTGFDPATPLPWIAAAVLIGVVGWALALRYVRHPFIAELQRLRARS